MKNTKWTLLVVLLVALLGLAACGGEEPEAAATSPSVTQAPAATATPVPPTATPEPTATTESAPSTGGEGTGLDLESLSAPSDLSSYRAAMSIITSGTEAGEAVDGTVEFIVEYTRQPLAQHISMSGAGIEGVEESGVVEMYQLEDMSYVKFGEEWLSMPSSEGVMTDTGIINPQDMLDDTCGWKSQADTEYEGISVHHWTMAKEDMVACMTAEEMGQLGNITAASGDLYVATEGNYIVHMNLLLEGTELQGAMGAEDGTLDEGTMEITFDMSDVNQPFTIDVPEDALASGAIPEDIPIVDGAEEVSNAFGMISFKTALTPAEVSDFYKAEMPNNGWTETSAQEMSGLFMLEYSKDGRTTSFTINTDDDSGKTSVLIVVGEGEG